MSTISKPVMTYYTVMIGKFFAGVSLGLFSGILPLYLSECASKNLRGLAGSMNQFSLVIGILVANVIGLPQLLGTPELWPYLAGLTFVPAIIHILLVFTSESPKYLFINKNNKEKAREGLSLYLLN
jgi:SP family facilitated glucose transporter-like MFS transporter 1